MQTEYPIHSKVSSIYLFNQKSLSEPSSFISPTKQPDPFFTMTPEDTYLKWIIQELKIADSTGKLYAEKVATFQLPPLSKEQKKSIQQLIENQYPVIGKRVSYPLNIPMAPKTILKQGKKAAIQKGAINGKIVKLYGTRLRHELGVPYTLQVFHEFFVKTLQIPHIKVENIITPFMQERLKKKGNDTDFQIRIPGINLKECSKIANQSFRLLEEAISTPLDRKKISHYLIELKHKITLLPGNKYLERILKEDNYLQEKHPRLIRTFLEVDALIQSADVQAQLKNPSLPENIFCLRSLGDRKEHNFDYVYVSSQARKGGVFTTHSLGLDIDSLIDNKKSPLIPFSPDNGGMQYFSDNNGAIYRLTNGKAEEEGDWAKSLCATLEGLRCLEKGTNKSLIDLVIQSAKDKAQDLASHIIALLKHTARFHLQNHPDKIMTLTYLACLSLSQEGQDYAVVISSIWQGIFAHLEELAKFEQTVLPHPFISEIRKILQSSQLTFKELTDFIQIFAYIGLNHPELVDPSAQVVMTQDETGLVIQLRLKKKEANKEEALNSVFLFPYEPHKALERVNKINHPQIWPIITQLYYTLISSEALLDSKQTSPLKSYSDHPSLQLEEVKKTVKLLLIDKSHFMALEIGYAVLFACLKQKFDDPFFISIFKLFIDQIEYKPENIQTKILKNIQTFFKGSFLEKNLTSDSKLMQNLQAAIKANKNQILELQLECLKELLLLSDQEIEEVLVQLLKKVNFASLSTESRNSLINLIIDTSKSKFKLALDMALELSKNPQVLPVEKIKVFSGIAIQCSTQSIFSNYIELISMEICNLLEKNLIQKKSLAIKNQPKISQIFQIIIQLLIKQRYAQKASHLLFLSLEQNWIEPNPIIAQAWLNLMNFFLENPDLGLVETYTAWGLSKKFNLDQFLLDSDKQNVLKQLCHQISIIQDTASSIDPFIQDLSDKASDSVIYPLFLKQFRMTLLSESKTKSHLSEEAIKNLLNSFIQLIQKNRTISTYWSEEKKILEMILQIIQIVYPKIHWNNQLIFTFRSFLTTLQINYVNQYVQELTNLLIVSIKQITPLTNEKNYLILSALLENLFFIFSNHYKQLKNETYQSFFPLLMAILPSYSLSHPFILSFKEIIKKPDIENILLYLHQISLHKETLQFLLFIKLCEFDISSSKILTPIIFEELHHACIEKTFLHLDQIEELAYFYLSLFKNVSSNSCKQTLDNLYQQLIACFLTEKNYSKAYKWEEKRKELEPKSITSPQLIVKAAHSHLLQKEFKSFEKLLNSIQKMPNTHLLESDLENIFRSLTNTTPLIQSANWLLNYSFFDKMGRENINLIIKMIENLILSYQKQGENYQWDNQYRHLLTKDLTDIFKLAEKFSPSKGEMWIQLILTIMELNDKSLCEKSFDFVFSNHFPADKLTPQELANCWNLAIRSIKKQGHPKLKELLETNHPLFSLYNQKDLHSLKLQTYKAFYQGLINYFKKLNPDSFKTFSKFYLIDLLQREYLLNPELNDQLLSRLKLIIQLQNPHQFARLGFAYLHEILQDQTLSSEFINKSKNQMQILLKTASKLKDQYPEIELTSLQLIRFIQEKDQELIDVHSQGKKKFVLPHMYGDHGNILVYLSFFQDKYLEEMNTSVRQLFITTPHEHFTSDKKEFLIQHVFSPFLKSRKKHLIETINWCRFHIHNKLWLSQKRIAEMNRMAHEHHPFVKTPFKVINELGQLILALKKVNQELITKSRNHTLIEQQEKLTQQINNKAITCCKHLVCLNLITLIGISILLIYKFDNSKLI